MVRGLRAPPSPPVGWSWSPRPPLWAWGSALWAIAVHWHFILATNTNNFFLFVHSRMTKHLRRTCNIQTSDAWNS